jgi:hypothetical protein
MIIFRGNYDGLLDNLKIEERNSCELLAISCLLPNFKRELATNREIAVITLEPEEIMAVDIQVST